MRWCEIQSDEGRADLCSRCCCWQSVAAVIAAVGRSAVSFEPGPWHWTAHYGTGKGWRGPYLSKEWIYTLLQQHLCHGLSHTLGETRVTFPEAMDWLDKGRKSQEFTRNPYFHKKGFYPQVKHCTFSGLSPTSVNQLGCAKNKGNVPTDTTSLP